GFEIVQDSRIMDLRRWKPGPDGRATPDSQVYIYRRLKVFKKADSEGNNLFRLHLLPTSPQTAVRFPAQRLPGRLRVTALEGAPSAGKQVRWEAGFDLREVPVGE